MQVIPPGAWPVSGRYGRIPPFRLLYASAFYPSRSTSLMVSAGHYKIDSTMLHKYPDAEIGECYPLHQWNEKDHYATLVIRNQHVKVAISDLLACGRNQDIVMRP